MTLEEKVGQLCQLDARRDAERMLAEQHPGSFLYVLGEQALRLQKLAEQTRLGIPLLFGIDAIHGHALYPAPRCCPRSSPCPAPGTRRWSRRPAA